MFLNKKFNEQPKKFVFIFRITYNFLKFFNEKNDNFDKDVISIREIIFY